MARRTMQGDSTPSTPQKVNNVPGLDTPEQEETGNFDMEREELLRAPSRFSKFFKKDTTAKQKVSASEPKKKKRRRKNQVNYHWTLYTQMPHLSLASLRLVFSLNPSSSQPPKVTSQLVTYHVYI